MVKEAAVPSTGQGSRNDGQVPLPSMGNIAVKCPKCKEILYGRDWEKNLKVCSRCSYHFRLTAHERINLLADEGSFVELDKDIISTDPLKFVSRSQVFAQKLEEDRKKTGLMEAVVTGQITIEQKPLVLAVMDFRFVGGSMGPAVGEKITRVVELGIERDVPVLISSASGGARMQEGIMSLMQMAKISAALAKLGELGIPYFSLLTDPTTGGVTASFAMQGDVILAEPGALVCFTGPRVIEQYMHIKLPEGTVNSEFCLQHGMIDTIVHRRDQRQVLTRLLHLYS